MKNETKLACFLHDADTGAHLYTCHLLDIVPGASDALAKIEVWFEGERVEACVPLSDISFCVRS